jgi:hypothetical protein
MPVTELDVYAPPSVTLKVSENRDHTNIDKTVQVVEPY